MQRDSRDSFGPYAQRAPTSVRLRHNGYQPPLAHRSIRHDWPEEIKRLWYSCQDQAAVITELEGLAQAPSFDAGRVRELVQAAYTNWRDIELYAAPIVAAWEAGQR